MLEVHSAGLAAEAAEVEAMVASLLGVHGTTNPILEAIVPPGIDPVSMNTTAWLHARQQHNNAVTTHAMDQMARDGEAIGDTAQAYQSQDSSNASHLGFGMG